MASAGTSVTTTPMPAAAPSAIVPIPAAVPSTWGTVSLTPNAAPDAHSNTLFGPGVPELTSANASNGRKVSTPAIVRGPVGSVLYDPADGPPAIDGVRAGVAAGGRWRPRGVPRAVPRARVSAPRPRHLDAVRRR